MARQARTQEEAPVEETNNTTTGAGTDQDWGPPLDPEFDNKDFEPDPDQEYILEFADMVPFTNPADAKFKPGLRKARLVFNFSGQQASQAIADSVIGRQVSVFVDIENQRGGNNAAYRHYARVIGFNPMEPRSWAEKQGSPIVAKLKSRKYERDGVPQVAIEIAKFWKYGE